MYENRVELIGFLGKSPERKSTKKTGRTLAILSLATKTWSHPTSDRDVHFAAATHNFKILEYIDPTGTEWEGWVDDPYLPKDGCLELRDRPGLGIEVDEEVVAASRYSHWQRTAPVRPDGSTGYV